MSEGRPLIVQSDRTVLLEVGGTAYAEARDAISPFAELEKSPEHVHTYRITPLSVWNAAATGLSGREMLETLARFSKYAIPKNVAREIETWVGRYGRVRLEAVNGAGMELVADDSAILAEPEDQFYGVRLWEYFSLHRDLPKIE